ncbi:MAG: cobalt transporter CbiM [Peptococcaceae bacterium]|jgi:cobalt/nickel transport system permease protein|nr:cobalt transporter CbiM [Peptococcaceae bacterium]
MHIPENYLSPATCAVLTVAVAPVLAVAVKKVTAELPKDQLPMLGIGAACAFLLMMFNVPLPGGTTGHAVGGTLIAILLGPYAAFLSVAVALALQALLFGDGGVLSLGANIFNMAFVLPFAGYFIYKFIKDHVSSDKGEYIGAALGSYIGINAAALIAAIEFGIQPLLFSNAAGQALYSPYPLQVSIPAMLIPHLLVAGVVEALFSVCIFSFIRKVSPGSIYAGAKKRATAVYGMLAALIVFVPLGLLAAGTAWGEWGTDEIASVVEGGGALGYVPQGMLDGFSFEAVMPDYSIAGLPEAAGYILSAIFGVALSIILFRLVSSLIKERKPGNA